MMKYLDFEDYARRVNCDLHYDIPKMPSWIKTIVFFPFGKAFARVLFQIAGSPEKYVSTYLDCADALGSMGEPYFEIYPASDGDTMRYLMDEQDQMYPEIIKSLRKMRKSKK